tara:strand:+ start:197 stop:313 length:117 start_codon:yes stop_codon:yes gene_type:complete
LIFLIGKSGPGSIGLLDVIFEKQYGLNLLRETDFLRGE